MNIGADDGAMPSSRAASPANSPPHDRPAAPGQSPGGAKLLGSEFAELLTCMVEVKVMAKPPGPIGTSVADDIACQRAGVARVPWTRGYDRSGCSAGSVGLGGGAIFEADLVASPVVEDLDVVEQDRAHL